MINLLSAKETPNSISDELGEKLIDHESFEPKHTKMALQLFHSVFEKATRPALICLNRMNIIYLFIPIQCPLI